MHPEQVIVTLHTESGQFEADYELPASLKAEKLNKLLLTTLAQQNPQQFGSWQGLRLYHNGAPLPDHCSLADRSLWDGSGLMIRKE